MEHKPEQTEKTKPRVEVRDLKPEKDAKAGGGNLNSGGQTTNPDGIRIGDGG